MAWSTAAGRPRRPGALRLLGRTAGREQRQPWPQPLTGLATSGSALPVLAVTWLWLAPPAAALRSATLLLATALALAVVVAYRYPLHLGAHAKVQLGTVPYVLLATLLAPPLAATVAGAAALGGELSVRHRRGSYPSDIAGAVGRRVLVVLAAALVAHLRAPVAPPAVPLVAAALVMGLLDIATAPLVLAPLSPLPLGRLLTTSARDAVLVEGAQYLLGLLGALLAAQELWALGLLAAPTALVYLAGQAAQRAAQAEQAAEQARQAAEEAVRVRDDFLTMAAHDLRTPLTAIVGRAELLQMRLQSGQPLSPAWLQAQVTPLSAAAARMVATVEEITDAAQLQVGQPLLLDRAPVDVGMVVAEVVSTTTWPQAGPIVRTVAPGLCVWGDRVRLERVVQNILENALKYSAPRTPVAVEGWATEGWVHLRVRDQGVGIPPQDLPHIFTHFYRASTAMGRRGTGLGLAGAQQIVAQHGGQIRVESVVGQGTTVTISLPRLVAGAPEPAQAPRGGQGLNQW